MTRLPPPALTRLALTRLALPLLALATGACSTTAEGGTRDIYRVAEDGSRDFVDAGGDLPDMTDGAYRTAPVTGTMPDSNFDVLARDFDRLVLASPPVPVGNWVYDLGGIVDEPDYASVSVTGDYRCAPEQQPCNRAAMAEGEVITHVRTLTPRAGTGDTPFVELELDGNGFNGIAGFSYSQARAALGEDGAFSLSCYDGRFRLQRELGDSWSAGEPLTVFWQETIGEDVDQSTERCTTSRN